MVTFFNFIWFQVTQQKSGIIRENNFFRSFDPPKNKKNSWQQISAQGTNQQI